MCKQAGAAASLRDDLKAMGEHVRHTAGPAKFHVVMHRMVVATGKLKSRKQRICHRP